MPYKFKPEHLIKLGLLLFVIFSPFSIAGAQTGLVLAILGWIVKLIYNKKIAWQSSFLDRPIIIYFAVLLITAIFSQNRLLSFISLKEEWLFLLFFLLVNSLEEVGFSKKLVNIIILISSIVAVYSIVQHYTGLDIYHSWKMVPEVGTSKFRAEGNFSIPLTYGFYTMVVSFLSFCLASYERRKNWQIFYYVASILCLTGNLFSYTRGTLLAQLFGFFIFFLFRGKERRKFEMGLVLVYFILIYFIDPNILRRTTYITQAKDIKTTDIRTVIWTTSFRIFSDYPVFGIGVGNFKVFYEKYLMTKSEIFGHAHNDFLNYAVNMGILGLAVFAFLWIVIWINFKKKFKQVKGEFFKPVLLSALVITSAYLLAAQFQCYFTDAIDNMILFFVLGIATAVDKIYRKSFA
jgi:O-antigen ligase